MKKVLVVDNHPMMLKFMTDLLEKKGHQVLTAGDGLSALETLKTYFPDVIFVDLVMPNICGEKLCRIVRSMPKLNHVCIIILSGIAAEEEIEFVEFGANACIAKGPLNKMAENVLAVLEQLDLRTSGDLPGKIRGLEDVFQREITNELLSVKRHSEVILSNMSEGIIELTIEGKIIYANPVAISLIGIPEEKLLASNFTEFFYETHRKRIEDLLNVIGDQPLAITADSPVELNGKQVTINILPIKDKKKFFIVILNDVTERKRIEDAHKQNHDTLNNILSASPIGIGLVEKRILKWANEAMIKMFGLESKEDYKDKNTKRFYSSEDEYHRVGQIIYNKLKTGEPAEDDVTFKRKNGSTFVGHVQMSCQNPSNPMERAIFTISDISWRKQAEAERLQKEKLQGVIEMAGAVCHELNQPMQVVSGYSELLMMGIKDDNPLYDKINRIKKQVDRMGDITKKLMGIAKYETKNYVSGKIIDIDKAMESSE